MATDPQNHPEEAGQQARKVERPSGLVLTQSTEGDNVINVHYNSEKLNDVKGRIVPKDSAWYVAVNLPYPGDITGIRELLDSSPELVPIGPGFPNPNQAVEQLELDIYKKEREFDEYYKRLKQQEEQQHREQEQHRRQLDSFFGDSA